MNDSRAVERAAGGVVMRIRGGFREVLLIDDAYGKVTFPKGHVEKGETWETAALREVLEETGIEARIVCPLGRVEYPIERAGRPVRKQVRLFLMEAIDEEKEPLHQEEEVAGAYFVPSAEAVKLHDTRGYPNWSFTLAKANLLWEWHERQLDKTWRQLPASTSFAVLQSEWQQAEDWVNRLHDMVVVELATVAPELGAYLRKKGNPDNLPGQTQATGPRGTAKLPLDLSDDQDALRRSIEHTLLKPDATELEIENLVHEALAEQFRGVCVNPRYTSVVAGMTATSSVIPCVVVGFPLGADDLGSLKAQVTSVVEMGAREVDMVVPIGSLCEDDIWTVFRYIQGVVEAAHQSSVAVKVILETHFLHMDQLVKGCLAAVAAGADFVKTSTGFAPGGARVADVAVMKTVAGADCGVKASGGIKTRTEALSFLRFGATRLGTSSGMLLIRQQPFHETGK